MDGGPSSRRVVTALAVAAVALAIPSGASAAKSIAGKYSGPTEYDGTVSFKLTKSGKITGFTLTGTLYCVTDPSRDPLNKSEVEYEKPVTVTHATIAMKGRSKKNPQGKRFEASDPAPADRAYQGGFFLGGTVSMTSGPQGGRVTGTGMSGDVQWETVNGPRQSPGTERCLTEQIDWEAKRKGSKGYVADPRSGHNRPPLSNFSAF